MTKYYYVIIFVWEGSSWDILAGGIFSYEETKNIIMLLFLSGRAPPGVVLERPPENNKNIIIFFGSSYKKIASWENVPGGALPEKNNNIIIFPGSCMACTGLSWDVVGSTSREK